MVFGCWCCWDVGAESLPWCRALFACVGGEVVWVEEPLPLEFRCLWRVGPGQFDDMQCATHPSLSVSLPNFARPVPQLNSVLGLRLWEGWVALTVSHSWPCLVAISGLRCRITMAHLLSCVPLGFETPKLPGWWCCVCSVGPGARDSWQPYVRYSRPC